MPINPQRLLTKTLCLMARVKKKKTTTTTTRCAHASSAMSLFIPKATTGLRPIGIFCALYRLWAKCHTAMAQSWENLNLRPYFPASKGSAVTDPIWTHAVVVDCGVGQGEETVSFWRDFAQAPHPPSQRGNLFELPFSAYKMQRVLVLHGEAASTGHHSKGVVAGCAIATYLVKLYCLLVMDNVVRLYPRVSLDVFIDDSHQPAQ